MQQVVGNCELGETLNQVWTDHLVDMSLLCVSGVHIKMKQFKGVVKVESGGGGKKPLIKVDLR